VDRHLRPETHPVVFEGVMRALVGSTGATNWSPALLRDHALPDDVGAHLAVVADVARNAVDGGDPALAPGAARVLARLSTDRDLLVGWLERSNVEQAVRWAAVHRLAELGDDSWIGPEEDRDRSVSGHHAVLSARAAVPRPEAKAAAWAKLMSGDLGSHEFHAVGAGFWGWEQAELVRPYLGRYVTDGLALARRSGQAMGDVIGDAFPRLPLPLDVRRELRAAVATALEGDVPTVLARSWNDSLDDLDRSL
jgi:aminopeptidase N